MENEALAFTEEDWEWIKIFVGVLLLLPALFALRFVVFMITPKFILKKFVRSKHGYKKGIKEKEKKFYED